MLKTAQQIKRRSDEDPLFIHRDMLDSAEVNEIVDLVGYGCEISYVQNVFREYLAYLHVTLAEQYALKGHWTKLSEVAKRLQAYLRDQRSVSINPDQLIIDAAQHIEGTLVMEISGLFDEALSSQLLEHMQAEDDLPQLQNISSWWELKTSDVTDELLERLSKRAAMGQFKGVCHVCK